MKVLIKGTNVILSQEPARNVKDAFLVVSKLDDNPIQKIDVLKGQKIYKLPEGFTKKNILALYLRVW